MKISYVNGEFVEHATAKVALEDRAYLFADGVYEVMELVNGKFVDAPEHFARLENSLAGIRIKQPMPLTEIQKICEQVVTKNHAQDNFIYIQISRGVARRAHPFPKAAPTLVVYLLDGKKPSAEQFQNGVSVITTEETRWKYRNYKTISLLPNVLAKQDALEKNAFEAWFIEDDGTVTEGSSTNAYIVKNKTIITHPATTKILCGVTRNRLLDLALKTGIKIEERPFTLAEALAADECFLSSTSSGALGVTAIDEQKITTGKPGEITKTLNELYEKYVTKITQAHGRSV